MNIAVLLGAPGSGKGTQAKRLIESENFLHYSTGDMLRAAIKDNSELGQKAKGFIDRGELVPDEVMIDLIQDTFAGLPADARVLLDGFPRTVPQAEALDAKELTSVDVALFFDIPESELVERLTGRRLCKNCGATFHIKFFPPKTEGVCDQCGSTDLYQRTDDSEDVVQKRLEVFRSQNDQLLSYYRDKARLDQVNANREASEVEADVKGTLLKWFK